MARLRAAVAAARSNGVRAGARLSHQASYRSVTLSRSSGADGAGVAADDLADGHLADAEGAGDAGRAVAHHVQGPQPQPGAAGVYAAARDGLAGHGEHRGGGAAVRPAAAAVQVRDGGPGQARGGGDGAVGAAVLAQTADVSAGRAGAGAGTASRLGSGRDRPGG